MYKIREEYRRFLPHFQPTNDLAYFVTARLADSLPKSIIEELHQEHEKWLIHINSLEIPNEKKSILADEQNRRYFGKFDQLLEEETGWRRHP